MKIVIETIPHSAQRYATPGDWFWLREHSYAKGQETSSGARVCDLCGGREEDNPKECIYAPRVLHIRASETGKWHYSALLAVHELIEALLCENLGITQEQVDEFDLKWEPNGNYLLEPGDDEKAPYNRQHQIASGIERMLCGFFYENWDDYSAAINLLSVPPAALEIASDPDPDIPF